LPGLPRGPSILLSLTNVAVLPWLALLAPGWTSQLEWLLLSAGGCLPTALQKDERMPKPEDAGTFDAEEGREAWRGESCRTAPVIVGGDSCDDRS
jgi:hypothetical protein